jgi:hypothetical protein
MTKSVYYRNAEGYARFENLSPKHREQVRARMLAEHAKCDLAVFTRDFPDIPHPNLTKSEDDKFLDILDELY